MLSHYNNYVGQYNIQYKYIFFSFLILTDLEETCTKQ